MAAKYRVFSAEFKQQVAQRILNGESVSALREELQVKRSVLYRWRDAYRKEGAAGLQRRVGRPPGVPNPPRPPAGPEDAAADVEDLRGADVIVRVEPGDIRAWDYADELGTG